MSKRFILFDIDGTLVVADGFRKSVFLGSFRDAFDIPAEELPDGSVCFAGATDRGLLDGLCAQFGLEVDEEIANYFFKLLDYELREALQRGDGKFNPLPGVPALLERLYQDKENKLGLVTGNIESTARRKLLSAEILSYFSEGGYGAHTSIRAKILEAALSRLEDRFPPVSLERCCLVGDTPKDILSAKIVGIPCVAVATGKYSVDELKEAGADQVFQDLTPADEIVQSIENLTF